LEQHVASADVIVIGTAVEFFTQPPLDPAVPDTLQHRGYVHVTTEEYLKGGGPVAISLATEKTFFFGPDGSVITGSGTCGILGESSIGRRYALFLNGALDSVSDPGICSGSISLTIDPSADESLQKVRAILQATPTTAPPVAPTEGSPGGLPRSGGASDGDSSLVGVATVAALSSLVLGAGLVWRWHNRRDV